MTQAKATENKSTESNPPKIKGQQKTGRAISDPKAVAQLVMMRIDHVNATKDELTTAVKSLADTAKQLVSVYAKQQRQIEQFGKKLEELEKAMK